MQNEREKIVFEMDDFADLLKFILPLVFFVGAAIFGKSNKQKTQPNQSGQSDFSSILDMIGDETELDTIPHTVRYPEPEPQPYNAPKPQQPEEGERAIVVETHENAEPEPEKIHFDAREAVIYSTILERKY